MTNDEQFEFFLNEVRSTLGDDKAAAEQLAACSPGYRVVWNASRMMAAEQLPSVRGVDERCQGWNTAMARAREILREN